MRHTPGPLKAVQDPLDDRRWGVVFADGMGETAVCHDMDDPEGESTEAKANAYLYAAAPDLLEALKSARATLYANVPGGVWNTLGKEIQQIDTAIAKAEAS